MKKGGVVRSFLAVALLLAFLIVLPNVRQTNGIKPPCLPSASRFRFPDTSCRPGPTCLSWLTALTTK